MGKILLLVLLVLLQVSCNEKKEVSIEDNIRHSVVQYIQADIIDTDSKLRLDSLEMVYIDTVTRKLQLSSLADFYGREIERLYVEGEDDREKQKLYAAIGSTDLYEIIKPRIDQRIDSMKYFQSVMNKAYDLSKTADSIAVLDYAAGYVYRITDLNSMRLKQDTLHFIVDKNYSIRPQSEYLKTIAGTLRK